MNTQLHTQATWTWTCWDKTWISLICFVSSDSTVQTPAAAFTCRPSGASGERKANYPKMLPHLPWLSRDRDQMSNRFYEQCIRVCWSTRVNSLGEVLADLQTFPVQHKLSSEQGQSAFPVILITWLQEGKVHVFSFLKEGFIRIS